MISEYWKEVESQLEGLSDALDEVESAVDTGDTWTARNELKNARNYADAVYGSCESWHCDTDYADDGKADGYSELLDVLPSPSALSAGDMISLLETVRRWKETRGYGY